MYGSWDMVRKGWTDGRIDRRKQWHIEVGAPPKNKQDGNQQITGTNKTPRKNNNNNLAKENNIKQLTIKEKKKTFIVDDSMIKYITETGISRDHADKTSS